MADARGLGATSEMAKGDDIELFHRWATGDVDAGQQLVRRHYGTVYCFFASKVEEHVAVELTQDTFETMCRKASSLQIHSSFVSYLFGIARWKLVEQLRARSGRGFDPLSDSFPSPDLEPGGVTWLARKREESTLVKALRQLPLDDQILLELRIYEALRMREIADILGTTKERVAARLVQAKRRLIRAAEGLCTAEETLTTLTSYMKEVRDALTQRLAEGGG